MARPVTSFPFNRVPDLRRFPEAMQPFMARHAYRPVTVLYRTLHVELVRRLDLVLRRELPPHGELGSPGVALEPPPRTVLWSLDLCTLQPRTGPLTTAGNLQTLCAACNLGKGAAWIPPDPLHC